MLGTGYMVHFCIDSVVVTSLLPEHVDSQIKVDVEHCSLKYSYNIFFEEDKSEKMLDIKETFYIDNRNPDYSVIVSIYMEEMKIYEKIFDLRQNMIGTINSDVYFPFCLIFRIINDQMNEIVIHNVSKYQLNNFEVVEILGNGASGVAYKVIDHYGQPHVFKVPNTKIDINNPGSNCMREIVSLIALPRHPCMIRLEGFIYNHDHGIILVLEYASRGRIDKIDFNSLEESDVFKILYGLFSCVAFIHDHGFIHRDLHYKNILVTEDYEARLIDFDVSRFYGDDLTHNVGHQGYMAPEMMGNGDYDKLIDEFSLGVLISDIFDKSSPFYILNFLLKIDDATKRSTCSEICTLLECEYLIDISSETESYITELTRYHESEEVNDYSIEMLAFSRNFILNNNACCNILKFIDAFDDPRSRSFYSLFILFDNNIALDTDYILCTNEQIPILIFWKINVPVNLSVEKINYVYNYLLKSHDIEVVSIYFFIIFWVYDWSIYFLKSLSDDIIILIFNCFFEDLETNEISIFLDSLYRKACKFDAIYLMELFSVVASEHYQTNKSLLTIFKKLSEYMVEVGDINTKKIFCKCLACIYSDFSYFDHLKSKYYAKKGFNLGNFKCASYLSGAYFYENKIKKSIKYLKIAAKHGNAEAMYILGAHYIRGERLQTNIEKGIKYLKKSVNKGYSDAQTYLASMYFAGLLVPQDFHQAFWYNSLALQQGCKDALCIRAMFYFYGVVVEQDFVKARILFEQSIDSLDRYSALEALWLIHLYGIGVEINIEKANYYLGLMVQEGYLPNRIITVDEAYIRSTREEMIPKILNHYRTNIHEMAEINTIVRKKGLKGLDHFHESLYGVKRPNFENSMRPDYF